MIHGIGCDLLDIRRFEKTYQRHPDALIKRLCTAEEQTLLQRKNNPLHTLAKIFAAKEALYKALRVSRPSGFGWQDAALYYVNHEQPALSFSKKLQNYLGQGAVAHLSLSDELPYILAYVVISVAPVALD